MSEFGQRFNPQTFSNPIEQAIPYAVCFFFNSGFRFHKQSQFRLSEKSRNLLDSTTILC